MHSNGVNVTACLFLTLGADSEMLGGGRNKVRVFTVWRVNLHPQPTYKKIWGILKLGRNPLPKEGLEQTLVTANFISLEILNKINSKPIICLFYLYKKTAQKQCHVRLTLYYKVALADNLQPALKIDFKVSSSKDTTMIEWDAASKEA